MKTKYLFFLLILLGCSSLDRTKEINDMNMQNLSKLTDSLSNIFPKTLDSNTLIYSGLYDDVENHIYMLTVPYSDTLDSRIKSKKHLAIYSANDPDLIIVGKGEDKSKQIKIKFKEDYIPTPNFAPINSSGNIVDLNKFRLSKEYTIYVLDASPGIFTKKSWLTEGLGLPEKWKNGYSRGYAISSNKKDKIIYWLIIW